jgi:hypothetical protein
MIRILLALFLAFLAPGYLLLRALYPQNGPTGAERWALVIGCSIAIVVIQGLLLELTPGGITATGTAWAMGVTVVGLAAIAVARARREGQRLLPRRGSLRSRNGSVLRLAAPCLIVVLLGIVAVDIARDSATDASRRSSFTQLWLIPHGDELQLGVKSFEPESTRFALTVSVGRRELTHYDFALPAASTFTKRLALPRSASATDPVAARLFIGAGDHPYRQVSWVPAEEVEN